jgi:16S rRNA (cytidine1402-2'-O)-methyltransferase
VVATPLGNLSDLSVRARQTLERADLILAEDTRHTRKLTAHYGIRTRLESYHDFNEESKTVDTVHKLAGGLSVAMVSDAGTPGISDPGYRLVRACREHGIPVVPVPGPSAVTTAVAVSGLPSDEFLFVGFLPSKREARRRRMESLATVSATLVFYEAPHRLKKMLLDAAEVFGPRRAFLAREMTKLHEEYLSNTLDRLAAEAREQGECVVIVEGAPAGGSPESRARPDLSALSRQEVLKLAAESLGVPRGELYDALFKKRDDD